VNVALMKTPIPNWSGSWINARNSCYLHAVWWK